MTARLRNLICAASACAVLLTLPSRTVSQSLFSPGHTSIDNPATELLRAGQFMQSSRENQFLAERIRSCQLRFRHALDEQRYPEALSFADSLIRLTEENRIPWVRFTQCYIDRAVVLKMLHRDSDACMAYTRALKVRDSLARIEQNLTMGEVQADYALDRLTLDQALLRARHHQQMLIAVILLLTVIAVVVGAIYLANRRTRRLQRELLSQLKQARESESKKVAFINSMCHEVRTPLNSLSGFSELLCTEDTDLETRSQYYEVVQESLRQLRYLFDDMLEVARLENLHTPLALQNVNLCALCRTQLRIMKVKYPKPELHYQASIPGNDVLLNTNERYLSILLAELLANAYKFTQQGTITLECDRLDEETAYIAVSDTGCGIPPESREYIFERFTKVDPFSQGNGLGLYLCRLIVRHLHGTIQIDPAYKSGTRVVVTLPRK